MNQTFETKTDLNYALTSYKDVLNDLESLKASLNSIGETINNGQWKGEAQVKCNALHNLILLYIDEIYNLNSSFPKNVSSLISNCDNFSTDSDQVNSIKGI